MRFLRRVMDKIVAVADAIKMLRVTDNARTRNRELARLRRIELSRQIDEMRRRRKSSNK